MNVIAENKFFLLFIFFLSVFFFSFFIRVAYSSPVNFIIMAFLSHRISFMCMYHWCKLFGLKCRERNIPQNVKTFTFWLLLSVLVLCHAMEISAEWILGFMCIINLMAENEHEDETNNRRKKCENKWKCGWFSRKCCWVWKYLASNDETTPTGKQCTDRNEITTKKKNSNTKGNLKWFNNGYTLEDYRIVCFCAWC